MRAANTIRYVMGPSGTTVTFPNEMGLPSIFESKTCRYISPFHVRTFSVYVVHKCNFGAELTVSMQIYFRLLILMDKEDPKVTCKI